MTAMQADDTVVPAGRDVFSLLQVCCRESGASGPVSSSSCPEGEQEDRCLGREQRPLPPQADTRAHKTQVQGCVRSRYAWHVACSKDKLVDALPRVNPSSEDVVHDLHGSPIVHHTHATPQPPSLVQTLLLYAIPELSQGGRDARKSHCIHPPADPTEQHPHCTHH